MDYTKEVYISFFEKESLKESLSSTIVKSFKEYKQADAEKVINSRSKFLKDKIQSFYAANFKKPNITFKEILEYEKTQPEWKTYNADEKRKIEIYVGLIDKYLK